MRAASLEAVSACVEGPLGYSASRRSGLASAAAAYASAAYNSHACTPFDPPSRYARRFDSYSGRSARCAASGTVSDFSSTPRAAERLVLVARGVDEKSLTVPEAAHLALRAEYESNLRAYRDGGPNGVHAWLLYAAEAYAAAAEASPLRLDAE